MNEKERKLIKLLKSYPHPNHTVDDRNGVGILILLSAGQNGWIDDFIQICEDNPNVSFDEILKLIFTEERYPPLEIVDDKDE